MQFLLQDAFNVGRPTFVEPEVGRVGVPVTMLDSSGSSENEGEDIYVTPFPNHEWVSSCTTTSTRLLSPVSNAFHGGLLLRVV